MAERTSPWWSTIRRRRRTRDGSSHCLPDGAPPRKRAPSPGARVVAARRFRSYDRDLARLGVLGLGQGQGQDAVFEVGADLFLIDRVRQRERASVVADVVLGVDRLHVLVLGEVDLSVDPQDVVLER